MIHEAKFEEALGAYKKAFNATHWNAERYKWVAIKNFQDNWDINAEDFLSMFNKATDKANNLLSSMNYYPRGMIQELIKKPCVQPLLIFLMRARALKAA